LAALLDVIAEPVRIIISFWQIVSSFNNSLAVPWPAVYCALLAVGVCMVVCGRVLTSLPRSLSPDSMTEALSVVSLQLLRLPTVACIQPEVAARASQATLLVTSCRAR
jgi:hypothetical protein